MTALTDRIDRERDIAYREHLRDDHMLASAGMCSDARLEDLALDGADACETCARYAESCGMETADACAFEPSAPAAIPTGRTGSARAVCGMPAITPAKKSSGCMPSTFRLSGSRTTELSSCESAGRRRMAEPKYPNLTVYLSSEDGNAFSIIGAVRKAMRRAKLSDDVIDEFTTEAKAGDYDHLLRTCMAWVDVR
jgi:hypothetical protein